MRRFLILIVLIFPNTGFAAVIINEVAWMGDADSANHEWIELHNNGNDTIDVNGWELTDGMKLSVILTGSIAANSYVVLERTSEESAAGTAFIIYTGALVNTGATLTLKRTDGSIEDQVGGGENWVNIGGDNVTKETSQYTTSGWITAVATPGKVNANIGSNTEPSNPTTDDEVDDESDDENKPRVSKHNSSEPVRLVLSDVTLQLEVGAQSVGYVNQTINFSVTPSGIGDSLMDSLVYVWNFGDGQVGGGKKPSHIFAFPGTYVVTVYGAYKRQEQVARHEITILPVTISLTRSNKGDLQLNNDSPYEIDISRYRLVGESRFTFPARSVLLPNQTISLSKDQFGTGAVSLYDETGTFVVREVGQNFSVNVLPSVLSEMVAASVPAERSSPLSQRFLFATSSAQAATTTSTQTATSIANTARVSAVETGVPANALPYLGLIGIIALGTIGVLVKPSRNEIS
jgi:hypothetical protein